MNVKIHPLAEILAKALFGIHGVPENVSRRMVARAIRQAVDWHENNAPTPEKVRAHYADILADNPDDFSAKLGMRTIEDHIDELQEKFGGAFEGIDEKAVSDIRKGDPENIDVLEDDPFANYKDWWMYDG